MRRAVLLPTFLASRKVGRGLGGEAPLKKSLYPHNEEGLSSLGVINVGDIYTIHKGYLIHKTGQLLAKKLSLLHKAINFALGLD